VQVKFGAAGGPQLLLTLLSAGAGPQLVRLLSAARALAGNEDNRARLESLGALVS